MFEARAVTSGRILVAFTIVNDSDANGELRLIDDRKCARVGRVDALPVLTATASAQKPLTTCPVWWSRKSSRGVSDDRARLPRPGLPAQYVHRAAHALVNRHR